MGSSPTPGATKQQFRAGLSGPALFASGPLSREKSQDRSFGPFRVVDGDVVGYRFHGVNRCSGQYVGVMGQRYGLIGMAQQSGHLVQGNLVGKRERGEVWRRPWKVTYRTPARSQSRRNRWEIESGLGGRPWGRVRMEPGVLPSRAEHGPVGDLDCLQVGQATDGPG